MPQIVVEHDYIHPVQSSHRHPKTKSQKHRGQQSLRGQATNMQMLYSSSELSQNLSRSLAHALKTTATPINRIISLGLGSLSWTGKGQTRRLKQFAILLFIRDQLQNLNKGKRIEVYAQDPAFTKADEEFLSSFGIIILRTSSASSLGESLSLISPSTLIYSPFLTLEAYEALFGAEPQSVQSQLLVSDDFNALREKWPKRSPERLQVEGFMKGAIGRYHRRLVQGAGYWNEDDESFPMAVYAAEKSNREKAKI